MNELVVGMRTKHVVRISCSVLQSNIERCSRIEDRILRWFFLHLTLGSVFT